MTCITGRIGDDFMGLVIDGNEVNGIAKGGQPFLAMQANKDGTINVGGNLYAKQDPIVGKDIFVNYDATAHYLNGLTITPDSGDVNRVVTVLKVLKDDENTYYFFNTYKKSSGLTRYAYVKSTDTKKPDSE